MHQFAPNDHLVSTSNWHSFPRDNFWANPAYPDVDFADVHRYIDQNDANYSDAAEATNQVSMDYGALRPGGAGKPVIRGETGFVDNGSEPGSPALLSDTEGIWLHNYIWGGINAGGLIESYWYENYHIYKRLPNDTYEFDHRPHYRTFFNFIADIPLNNGYFQDAEPVTSNETLRVWGQKDLVNGVAHLWIQNKNHTWENVVNGVQITPMSGTITLAGFLPNTTFDVQWWDTYETDPALQILQTEMATSDTSGVISFNVSNLTSDIAVKLASQDDPPTTTFLDVPVTHPYYEEIEALWDNGYTAGCSTDPLMFCPDSTMNRAESAVFVERGAHSAEYFPPQPTITVFADVPLDEWFAKWATGLWNDGYTAGCGTDPLIYCPLQGHTRAEGAVFYLRMLHGTDYIPPDPSGIFADVPLDIWYAKWVEAAFNAGLIEPCGTNPLRFCPEDPLTRAVAAYMMVQAKGLTSP
jgi:hypothetical protein